MFSAPLVLRVSRDRLLSRITAVVHKNQIDDMTDSTYFAMMLPGNAKLRVCFLPFVGLKTADGLDVSTVSEDCLLASPELSLRFCEMSVNV